MNTAVCDESTAKFMAEALLSHAREISRYARTYPAVFAGIPSERARKALNKFVKSVTRMVKEMHALMLMARYKGVSRYCNQEQVEAYMDEAMEIVDKVGRQNRETGMAINAEPALLN